MGQACSGLWNVTDLSVHALISTSVSAQGLTLGVAHFHAATTRHDHSKSLPRIKQSIKHFAVPTVPSSRASSPPRRSPPPKPRISWTSSGHSVRKVGLVRAWATVQEAPAPPASQPLPARSPEGLGFPKRSRAESISHCDREKEATVTQTKVMRLAFDGPFTSRASPAGPVSSSFLTREIL